LNRCKIKQIYSSEEIQSFSSSHSIVGINEFFSLLLLFETNGHDGTN